MLSWLLRIVLILLIVRAVWRFARGVIQGASTRARGETGGGAAVHLVKDPVCGTYVQRGRALEASARGESHHFCSTECRDDWLRSRGRRTA